MQGLQAELERLYAETDHKTFALRDPVAFVHRYTDPADQEVAGILAALMAFGKVDLFRPVLTQLFDHMDDHGGPAAWISDFDPAREAGFLDPIVYRWVRGPDLSVLFSALRQTGPLGPRFERAWRTHGAIKATMITVIDQLRAAAADTSGVTSFSELPRGARYLLASPVSGGAAKRWCLLLRWMVRSPLGEGIDVGLWNLPTSALVVPLDTHVGRISRLVGLTQRKTAGWRMAEEITLALSQFDPEDPLRFDFALAHLGISSRCEGRFVSDVCPSCPLVPVCAATML